MKRNISFQGQNPDGAPDGDFMSEAKDWAGELISGQTGTGRILVSAPNFFTSSSQLISGRTYQVALWMIVHLDILVHFDPLMKI